MQMTQFPLRIFTDKKQRGEPLAMVSLYDAPTASLCCEAGVDALLVGDSLGNVILGYANTIPVSMHDMMRHTGAVVRGVAASSRPNVPVVADFSFGAALGSRDTIVANATALMQAGAHGVKLEGAGPEVLQAISLLQEMGAPVMGHLGFTPQSTLEFSSVVQGKTATAATRLREAALRLQDHGCFAIVLEAIPAEVAATITEELDISTIGIGAGAACSGQVLVWHDLVGFQPGAPLRFVKRYAQAYELLRKATASYIEDVHAQVFPAAEHSWTMDQTEREAWKSSHDERDE
jgi:3-methyl-2-oxobutanoate hydroxymethyltransferase